MTKRIFRSIFIVALSVFFASLVLIISVLYDYFLDNQQHQLKLQTELAAAGVIGGGKEYLESLDSSDLRVTWIDENGDVLFDSSFDASEMSSHLDREEIKEALSEGYGESIRYSDTLSRHSLYSALKLSDGSVLRLSMAQSTVWVLLLGMVQPVCAVFVIAAVLSLVLAYRLSKNIVKPLNSLNLDDPLSNEEYDELSPLLRRIDSQQKKLKKQSMQLKRSRNELDTVTGNMNEGLVLLNNDGVILSINRAACRILSTDASSIGTDIISVSRLSDISELISAAQGGKRAERVITTAGGEYQFDVSPVISEGSVSGAVLLIFDVTEKTRAEQMRREFTANVSHELKNPLHSISGYAELLAGGMVKDEDTGTFAAKIYTEAQRMIRLVEDIIKLSHLDENAEDLRTEACDLAEIAENTVESLRLEAAEAGVSITCSAQSAVICGVSQQLQAIIYNLCDNAIKYNRPGGSVNVTVKNLGDTKTVEVRDTGIGIPAEHQERIFERFYRVDKSHSKELGGTGLGLSIVKHAARLHNAGINLQSTEGVGTAITVSFPA